MTDIAGTDAGLGSALPRRYPTLSQTIPAAAALTRDPRELDHAIGGDVPSLAPISHPKIEPIEPNEKIRVGKCGVQVGYRAEIGTTERR